MSMICAAPPKKIQKITLWMGTQRSISIHVRHSLGWDQKTVFHSDAANRAQGLSPTSGNGKIARRAAPGAVARVRTRALPHGSTTHTGGEIGMTRREFLGVAGGACLAAAGGQLATEAQETSTPARRRTGAYGPRTAAPPEPEPLHRGLPARDRLHQPAVGQHGGRRHSQGRRQRDRRGHRRQRHAQPGRADELRPGRRPVRHRLERERAEALRPQRQRPGALRLDAGEGPGPGAEGDSR